MNHPELPRPYIANSQAAKDHQAAMERYIAWKERQALAEIAVLPNMDQRPRVMPRQDYEWRDMTQPKRKLGAEYFAQKKRESIARQTPEERQRRLEARREKYRAEKEARLELIREGLMERRTA